MRSLQLHGSGAGHDVVSCIAAYGPSASRPCRCTNPAKLLSTDPNFAGTLASMWIMGCLIGHHEAMARNIETKLCNMMKAVSRVDEVIII